MRRKCTGLGLVFGAVALLGCGAGVSRFALRPPLLHDSDDRPFTPAPEEDPESELANGLDQIFFRPLADAFLFQTWGEAHNVNSLDEVPDSTWFENRTLTPEQVARGNCPEQGPTPPFTVTRSKGGGDTPGLFVEDATGQRFLMKLDQGAPNQPEITTAADAIVSRIYHAAGFNAPCNEVLYVRASDFRLDEESVETVRMGRERRLTRLHLDAVLDQASRDPAGRLRVMASRFIDGQPIGNWRTEGTREDDPNDVIPHEDRRELRGERLLAAWVAHWDSRGPNTFDSYVSAEGGGGYVVHYFLDFGDCLGADPSRTEFWEPRTGYVTMIDGPTVAADALTFGFIRRPWEDVEVDPRYPNLGFFGTEQFEPMGFSAQHPLERWERAQPNDLAWMARRLARLGPEHIRAAVGEGQLSDPAEEERLVEVLVGRRARILRHAFERRSPLADLEMEGPRRLCATDLGVRTGVSDAGQVGYHAEARTGAPLEASAGAPALDADGDRVCVELPAHFAPAGAEEDAAERYAVVTLERREGDHVTVLRAHFYDLGQERGYALVGVERL